MNIKYLLVLCFLIFGCINKNSKVSIKEDVFQNYLNKSFVEIAKEENLDSSSVYFFSNVSGEVNPCGCSFNPKGGLDRRLNFINSIKDKENVLIVDAGNALFPSEIIKDENKKLLLQNAKVIASSHSKMGVQFSNVGYLDLAYGYNFLKDLEKENKYKYISSNIFNGSELAFEESVKITINKINYLILGLSTGQVKGKKGKLNFKDPILVARSLISKANKNQNIIILSDMSREMDIKLANSINRPMFIFNGRENAALESPFHVQSSLLMQAGFQGQQWGVMNFTFKDKTLKWLNLSKVNEYNRKLKNLNSEKKMLENSSYSQEQKTSRIKEIDDSLIELRKYVPTNKSTTSYLTYKLIDMNYMYDGENELTKYVTKN